MSQLTITAYYTRQTLKFGTIFLIIFILLKTSFGLAHSYWRKLHPPPPPPPNTAFGKLPAINFPKETNNKPNRFQLETATGDLPKDIPNVEKVYFIPQIGGRFLSLEKATELARKLGFTDQPQKINEDTYRFENSLTNTLLTINVLTQNFHYRYDYLRDQTLINPPALPSETEAFQIAQSFLGKISKLTEELKNGEYRASYWKISADRLVSAVAPAEADFVRVDIFREKIGNQYPILPPNPSQSLTSILISGIAVQNEKVVEAKFIYFPVDREKFATYPLKTVDQAWQELQGGKFFLASFESKQKTDQVKIRKIYLGYFDPPGVTRFLQPIFVFQGDNNFYGYVPAISVEWVE